MMDSDQNKGPESFKIVQHEIAKKHKNNTKPKKNTKTNTIALCAFKNRNKCSNLLIFSGEGMTLDKMEKCNILIDSGCEDICISKKYADQLKLKRKPSEVKAELWDGTLVPMDECLDVLNIQIGKAKFKTNPFIVDLIGYDVILGKTWLKQYNPRINWKRNTVLVNIDNKNFFLDAESVKRQSSREEALLSKKQFAKLVKRQKSKIYLVTIHPKTNQCEQDIEKNISDSKDDELQRILEEYKDVFPEDLPKGLPPKRQVEMEIKMKDDTAPVMGPMYKLSPKELKEMRKQIKHLLSHEFIKPSISPWGSPVLFTPKKDGSLRMCVDYRALNKKTIKNNVPLPRIDEVWDQLGNAKYFTTLDLRAGYNQIRIKENDIPKTAFRTRYGQFEYLVTPFGLTGTPGCFQTLMNNIFRPHLDEFVMVYLDDILIYSKTRKEHLKHLRIVLDTLRKEKLYGKLSKCHFMTQEVEYLGHIITPAGIKVDKRKIEAVAKWPIPTTVRDVQSFIGLCNYYRKFIKDFAKIATPLTELTKEKNDFVWNKAEQEAFDQLKKKLVSAPLLRCANPSLPYEVTTDASATGLGAVLMQEDENGKRPIAYASKKLNEAEQNYSTGERELLAIIFALKTWRSYLHGSRFTILTDHHPLKFLETQKTLSRKQARWVEYMQQFDHTVSYIKGKENRVADALSRKNTEVCKTSTAIIKSLFNLSTIRVSENTLKNLETDYKSDPEFSQLLGDIKEPYNIIGKRLYFENRLCIPNGKIRKQILHDNHYSLHGGHRSYQKTILLLRKQYYWKKMKSDVKKYVTGCERCQKAKSMNKEMQGLLHPFPPPVKKWEVITMDFIFDLPKSEDYTGIMAIVDKLSKRAHFIPLTDKSKAPDIAHIFYKEVYRHHGLPRTIVSDRDNRFTSVFWTTLMNLLQIKLNLSTSFHPQTDGQTERMFRTLEEMLRCYISYTQRDWIKYLPGLEFAYNNHTNSTTNLSPFFLEYGQDPITINDLLHTEERKPENNTSFDFLRNIRKAEEAAKSAIEIANTRNSDNINQRRRPQSFNINEYVLLSTKNLMIPKGRSKKFIQKYIGPFRIISFNKNKTSYKLDLPKEYKLIHPTFHVSLLKPFNSTYDAKQSMDIQKLIHKDNSIPIHIIGHRIWNNVIQYLLRTGQDDSDDIWLNENDTRITTELLDSYKSNTQKSIKGKTSLSFLVN